jgi:hypothetical protein
VSFSSKRMGFEPTERFEHLSRTCEEVILIGFPGALLVSELIQYEVEAVTLPIDIRRGRTGGKSH